MRRVILAVLLPAVLLTGCGEMPDVQTGQAADRARDKAVRVRDALGSRRLSAAEDVGRAAAGLDDVEVMEVGGRSLESPGGVRLVIRVQGTSSTGWAGEEPVTVRRCFALEFRGSMYDESGPERVPCPDGPPRTFGPWPERPRLPDGAYERLRGTLPKVPAGGTVDEARVRRAVNALKPGRHVRVEIAAENGVVGVSLRAGSSASPDLDCLLARVAPGRTDVWVPPRIQLMPGEAGCGAGVALHPVPPPH